jgi:Type IV secretion-system coupling protein DNA-binding domain
MPTAHEQLSEQFYQWELRGRGWQLYGEPVHLEPPFVPFTIHRFPKTPPVDTGSRPSFLGSLVRGLGQKLAAQPPPQIEPEPEEEPEPTPLPRDSVIELQTSLSAELDIAKDEFEQLLLNLSLCREPIAFELLGIQNKVTAQFAAASVDVPFVRRQLQAHFPETLFKPGENVLARSWDTCSGEEELVVEFGLGREFMFLLASGKLDPFVGIVAALSELQADELGLFQVLWQPVHQNWQENILNAVTDVVGHESWQESIVRAVTGDDGKPFFVNMPELTKAAKEKVSKPLYAAVVRIAAKAGTFDRALEIARDLASSLRVLANPSGNELIPLKNDDYPLAEHVEDVMRRQSRRCGMLLNSDELIGFVHLPSNAVRSPMLQRQTGKEAPAIVRQAEGLMLGNNVHFDESVPVRLSPDQRVYHTHIIGATGTGKSTLLFNLIRQDIENMQGMAVLDPHGDLIEKILGVIPENRIKDVILVDPADEEFSIGFNILSAHSDHEKTLLASDLVSVFQRLSISWGDQMQIVLQNAILAFLNSSEGGTLADLRRFLVEPAFRQEFLKSVSDLNVLYYWQKGFAHLSGNKSIGPILTRLEMFLAQRPIAHMVSQPENRLDFGEIMDSGKIFLAKLPEGLLGKENSYLLGAVLVSKFQQLVMARQAKKIAARRPFWIYIDEFANFITPSMAEILSGARKYRIGLTLAHHELHQLQRSPDVASAVMTHPYTRIVFRVGDDDARKLADGFSSFEANDLKNLETGQAICRVQRSDYDFNLSIPMPEMPDDMAMIRRQEEVIAASAANYGTPRAQVEAMLRQAWEVETQKPVPVKSKPPQDEPPPSPSPVEPIAPVPPPAPKVEVPKDTDSEKKIVEPPRDLGRGGAQHQAIQQRIKKAAEELGLRSVIEKPILEGQGSVDLLLERDGQGIACEISISTTIDHEVGNVSKCLKAGFSKIAVICLDDERLLKIKAAVSGSLGPEMAERVEYFRPDPFIAYLKQLKSPMPQPSETEHGGYKIRRSAPKLSAQEREQKEDIANRVMAEAMRRK